MNKAIGAGEVILDMIFSDGLSVTAVPGGSVFNSMVSLARTGFQSLFVSETGNDRVWQKISDFMRNNAMSIDWVTTYEDISSAVSLAFSAGSGTEYRFFRETPQQRKPFKLPNIKAGDVVLLSSYFAVNPALRDEIEKLQALSAQNGATLIYDINFRPAHAHERNLLLPAFLENIRSAHIVRASTDDLALLFPGLSRETVYKKYIDGKVLILTDGANDIWLKTSDIERSFPVGRIKPVSTVGAGDSFNAGIAARLLADDILPETLVSPSETLCERIVAEGLRFASAACLSVENYVPRSMKPCNLVS